jgi:hypothetical protein
MYGRQRYEGHRNAGRSFGLAQVWDIWEALEKWKRDASSVADVGAKGRGLRVRGLRHGRPGAGTDLRECEAGALTAPSSVL